MHKRLMDKMKTLRNTTVADLNLRAPRQSKTGGDHLEGKAEGHGGEKEEGDRGMPEVPRGPSLVSETGNSGDAETKAKTDEDSDRMIRLPDLPSEISDRQNDVINQRRVLIVEDDPVNAK